LSNWSCRFAQPEIMTHKVFVLHSTISLNSFESWPRPVLWTETDPPLWAEGLGAPTRHWKIPIKFVLFNSCGLNFISASIISWKLSSVLICLTTASASGAIFWKKHFTARWRSSHFAFPFLEKNDTIQRLRAENIHETQVSRTRRWLAGDDHAGRGLLKSNQMEPLDRTRNGWFPNKMKNSDEKWEISDPSIQPTNSRPLNNSKLQAHAKVNKWMNNWNAEKVNEMTFFKNWI